MVHMDIPLDSEQLCVAGRKGKLISGSPAGSRLDQVLYMRQHDASDDCGTMLSIPFSPFFL